MGFSKYHNWKVETGEANWFIDCGMEEDSEANANLIAAAPDMYEALKSFSDALVEANLECRCLEFIDIDKSYQLCYKALHKADGK